MGQSESNYVLCIYLRDDQNRADALKDAIDDEDSPELLRIQPFNKNEVGGLWVRDNLVRADELERAKSEQRYYRDDKSTFQWIWSPDNLDNRSGL